MALSRRGFLALFALLPIGLSQGAPEEELPLDEQCDVEEAGADGCAAGVSLRQLRGQRLLQVDEAPHPSRGMRPVEYQEGQPLASVKTVDMQPLVGDDMGSFGATVDGGGPGGANDKEADAKSEANRGSKWTPWDAELKQPSGGKLNTFYMYRAVSDEVYPPINVNAASLGGVLWYLHHEVVVQYPRKFGITKIVRFKVQTKATKPLLKLGLNFGPRTAFDSGQVTGPFVCGRIENGGEQPKFCDGAFNKKYENSILDNSGKPYNSSYEYSKFGYTVGCNKLGEWPFPTDKNYYPGATWYSLPGPCSSKVWDQRTQACEAEEPGGKCGAGVTPAGTGDCTWNYELMGEVSIDDLVDVPVASLKNQGGREYDPYTDKGFKTSWWDGINNTESNAKRAQALSDLFLKQYPNQIADAKLEPPECDFNFGTFYREFWFKDPFGGECEDAKAGSACDLAVKWAMQDGIYGNPAFYPGLTPQSSRKEFQRSIYAHGTDPDKASCLYRPCDERDLAKALEDSTTTTGSS